jgi:hypothetical protein
MTPGFPGSFFLSASAAKDNDKHFSLDFRCCEAFRMPAMTSPSRAE